MSEEKKNDPRPYWQQRRDQKLGAKPAEIKKEQKDSLSIWYDMQTTMSPAKCENCGRNLQATINFHPRAHICHIVPKSPQQGCPSVATHPLNRWFGCVDCHTAYDKESAEVVETMPVITICRERLANFIDKIPANEIRRVPSFLIQPAAFEESPDAPAAIDPKPIKKAAKKNVKSKNKPTRGPGGKFAARPKK